MATLKEETLRSEQVFDGKLLKVFRDEARVPDGNTSVREWINHPGASAVVPVFEDGSTLLVRQFRYPPKRLFLEVPAGKLDKEGEDPVEVAARELAEETGWRAERFSHLGSLYPCIGYSNEIIHFYVAEGLTEGETNLSDGEFVEVERLPLQEAIAMAKRGELLDMKTVVALLMAANHLEGRTGEAPEKT